MWDQIPPSGVEPRTPALGVWSLSHWTARESLLVFFKSRLTFIHQDACSVSSVLESASLFTSHSDDLSLGNIC